MNTQFARRAKAYRKMYLLSNMNREREREIEKNEILLIKCVAIVHFKGKSVTFYFFLHLKKVFFSLYIFLLLKMSKKSFNNALWIEENVINSWFRLTLQAFLLYVFILAYVLNLKFIYRNWKENWFARESRWLCIIIICGIIQ